jgi:Rod binding domain-containing protein
MEKQFIRHMIDEMQKTVKSQEEQGPGAQYYKSLLADKRSDIMAQVENGIGLKEIILDQIVPTHLKNQPSRFDAVKMYNKGSKVQGEN